MVCLSLPSLPCSQMPMSGGTFSEHSWNSAVTIGKRSSSTWACLVNKRRTRHLHLNLREPLKTHQGETEPRPEKLTPYLGLRWTSVLFLVLHMLFIAYIVCVCCCLSIYVFIRLFLGGGLFRAAPMAYGNSQARDQIRAVAAGLHHSHSHRSSTYTTPDGNARSLTH